MTRFQLRKTLHGWLQKPIQRWIQKKLPPSEQVQLGLNNIMILPTKLGLILLLLCATVFLMAVNYANSMGYAICFFLLSIWLLALHATFHNLAGLQIKLLQTSPAHAGDDVQYLFDVSAAQGVEKHSVEFFWQEPNYSLLNLGKQQSQPLAVFCSTYQRGYLQPGRLQIVSYFPLMLFRAWSSMALSRQALIFPKPVACVLPGLASSHCSQQQANHSFLGDDELAGVRPYQGQDPLHHVAWKASAKQSNQWISKLFESNTDETIWLSYEHMPGTDHEIKLSQLCYWCLELEQQQVRYGLNIQGVQLAPQCGAQHLMACLTALATQPRLPPLPGDAHETR